MRRYWFLFGVSVMLAHFPAYAQTGLARVRAAISRDKRAGGDMAPSSGDPVLDRITLMHNKDSVYVALDAWLAHPPVFKWTVSAMAQPTALGRIFLRWSDDFQADRSSIAYGRIITDLEKNAGEFIRYSWSNGKSKATLTVPSLGDNASLDWQRMGNLGYRLFGYVGITAAIGDTATMDTLSLMVANQFSFQINKPGAPAIAAMYDGSLQQHGPQIFNIGYGRDWLNDMGNYAGWVKGTRWQLTEDQQAFWADMLLNGMQWMVYKGYTAHNIVGRHDAEKGSLRADISGLADKFLRAADIQLPRYAAVLAMRNDLRDGRCLSDSVKYFWDANVILVHSPRYFASIRMLSDRVVGTESSEGGLAQGLNNFYMADGSCLVYRNGTEYDAARLGWNWRCIPGATIKQKSGPLPLVPWSHGYESNNRISGGVTDGRVSIGAFYLDRANPYAKTKAVKAYFTFPDILLCMGNSVSDDDTARGDIYTTLNQTARRTAIYYSVNGGAEQAIRLRDSAQREFRITSPSWYWQDSTGYIILPADGTPTLALLQAGERRGNWQDIDKRNPDITDAVNIFQLCINHGSAASGWNDRSYRYVIVPSVSRRALAAFFKSRILQKGAGSLYINYNNERVVSATYEGYTGLVFMGEKGDSATALGPDGLAVSADKPAVLLLERTDSGMDIHVSDAKVSFEPGNRVGIHINRVFAPGSALPAHAEGAWKLEATAHGAAANVYSSLSVDLSKTDPVYTGEPIDIRGAYRYEFNDAGLRSAGSTHDAGLRSTGSIHDTGLPSAGSILSLMKHVADWQLNTWSRKGMEYPGYNWVYAVCYTGLFALGHMSGEQKYYDALRAVGDSLDWKTGPRKGMADDYCIGQTYAQLYGIYKEPGMIADFRSQADSICARPHTGSLEWKNNIHLREWAWCDALFMGPPALAYLSSVTGERKYLDKADSLWWKTTAYLFDKKEDLYYRDSRYFSQREANGAKMFWSRGNGWVMGGLVRMLSNMPDEYADRPRFTRLYTEMAKRIAALQQPDGTWHTSLLDPGSYPNEETSGTGLYCYALAWGIDHGILPRKHYLRVVLKSWQALASAVHPDGKLGYVQKVGDKPGAADGNSTEAYGPGAFLLAGSEVLKLE